MTSVACAFTVTVTVPDAWPDVGGVVGVVGVVVPPVPVPPVPPVLPVPLDEPPVAPTFAVTVACCAVDRIVDAMPLLSVVTSCVERVPALVVNDTGTPLSTLPFTSSTLAVIVVEPPSAET